MRVHEKCTTLNTKRTSVERVQQARRGEAHQKHIKLAGRCCTSVMCTPKSLMCTSKYNKMHNKNNFEASPNFRWLRHFRRPREGAPRDLRGGGFGRSSGRVVPGGSSPRELRGEGVRSSPGESRGALPGTSGEAVWELRGSPRGSSKWSPNGVSKWDPSGP